MPPNRLAAFAFSLLVGPQSMRNDLQFGGQEGFIQIREHLAHSRSKADWFGGPDIEPWSYLHGTPMPQDTKLEGPGEGGGSLEAVDRPAAAR